MRARLLVVVCLGVATVARAVSPDDEAAQARADIARIAQLQEQIEALLESLPADLREQVEAVMAAGGDVSALADRLTTEATKSSPGAAAVKSAPAGAADASPTAEVPRGDADRVALADIPESAGPAPCRALAPLDTNGDAELSAADRYWRHLYLWFDDGDGEVEEKEVASVYEEGVRRIALDLSGFTTAASEHGRIEVGEAARFVFPGRSNRREPGALAISNDGLERAGGPLVVDADGGVPRGTVPLRPSFSLREPSGRLDALSCLGSRRSAPAG